MQYDLTPISPRLSAESIYTDFFLSNRTLRSRTCTLSEPLNKSVSKNPSRDTKAERKSRLSGCFTPYDLRLKFYFIAISILIDSNEISCHLSILEALRTSPFNIFNSASKHRIQKLIWKNSWLFFYFPTTNSLQKISRSPVFSKIFFVCVKFENRKLSLEMKLLAELSWKILENFRDKVSSWKKRVAEDTKESVNEIEQRIRIARGESSSPFDRSLARAHSSFSSFCFCMAIARTRPHFRSLLRSLVRLRVCLYLSPWLCLE